MVSTRCLMMGCVGGRTGAASPRQRPECPAGGAHWQWQDTVSPLLLAGVARRTQNRAHRKLLSSARGGHQRGGHQRGGQPRNGKQNPPWS